MIGKLKDAWNVANPLTVGTTIQGINGKIDNVCKVLGEDDARILKLEEELKFEREESDKYKSILKSVSYSLPDMLWSKDINGVYLYANIRIREDLFYGREVHAVLGKTDVQLAAEIIADVGAENHTFGAICGNSDLVVLKTERKQRFLEWGLINGKDVYLEVYKAPIYDKTGKLIGTCGTGRDVTDYYLGLKSGIEELEELIGIVSECPTDNGCYERLSGLVNVLREQLDKYKFEG